MTRAVVIRSSLFVLGGVLVVGLTGCVPFMEACPAIGYSSTITVKLTGDTTAVDRVQFCDSAGSCSATNSATIERWQPNAAPSSSPLTMPSGDPVRPPDMIAKKASADRWTVSTFGPQPTSGTASAFRKDGSLAGETTHSLRWKRVGGSERCGGPTEAVMTVRVE